MIAVFLSTPSARRATEHQQARRCRGQISIHALREEGDVHGDSLKRAVDAFLSTPSARRATSEVRPVGFYLAISIHALREEGDAPRSAPSTLRTVFLSTPSARRATMMCVCGILGVQNFYPRPPRGGRQVPDLVNVELTEFLSTPSARRATPRKCPKLPEFVISIHALREEGDSKICTRR